MPEDYELYYGFTRFAIELNELDLEMAKILPKTDTRFRPDQRWIVVIELILLHFISDLNVLILLLLSIN